MTWIFLACLAALFKSLATITEKKLLVKEDSSDYLSGISFLIAICSLPLLYLVKDNSINQETLLLIFTLSIVSVIDAYAITYIIKQLDISESSALLATTPIIIAIFGVTLIGEFLTPLQVIGIALSSLGLFVLEFRLPHRLHLNRTLHTHFDSNTIVQPIAIPDIAKNPHPGEMRTSPHSKFTLYSILILGLIFFGLSSIGDRYVIHYLGVDPLFFLVLLQLLISLNVFIYEIIKKIFRKKKYIAGVPAAEHYIFNPRILKRKGFWINTLLIMAHRITHMFAINLVAASLLNAVKQINAVITTVLGGALFKEKELVRRTIACLIILGGAILVIL